MTIRHFRTFCQGHLGKLCYLVFARDAVQDVNIIAIQRTVTFDIFSLNRSFGGLESQNHVE